MNLRDIREIINEAAEEWQADKASRLGAALAYYSTFSIGPLLILTIAVAGMVFGEEAAQGELLGQLRGLIGEEGAKALQVMLASAQKPAESVTAAIVGAVMLLVGATGLFGTLLGTEPA
jgi:membrane protein